jgi:hypothetical protein
MRCRVRGRGTARERPEARGGVVGRQERLRELVARMSDGPIAEVPEKANEQHYELPAAFLALILGPRMKYSGCLWPGGVELGGAARVDRGGERATGADESLRGHRGRQCL